MEDYITLDGGAVCWHVEDMPFSYEIQQIAERELNERTIAKDVELKTLREMVKNQKDFTSRMDDAFLLRFLRSRKFDVDKTFKLLRNYYRHRLSEPQIYESFRPSDIQDFLHKSITSILPYRDPEGRPILRMVPGEDVPPIHICLRIVLFCLETLIDSQSTQVNGFVIIVDCSQFTLRAFRQLASPSTCKSFFSLIQDCFPARFKALHVLFEKPIVDIAYAICKPFLKAKTKDRIHFHGYDLESLHQYLPPAILPEEYGGELVLDKYMTHRLLLKNEEILVKNSKFGFKE